MNKMISVIIPAYNEEGMIAKTAETISSILTSAAIDHELIFVNDGSKDSTWDKIQEAAGKIRRYAASASRGILGRKQPCLQGCITRKEPAVW